MFFVRERQPQPAFSQLEQRGACNHTALWAYCKNPAQFQAWAWIISCLLSICCTVLRAPLSHLAGSSLVLPMCSHCAVWQSLSAHQHRHCYKPGGLNAGFREEGKGWEAKGKQTVWDPQPSSLPQPQLLTVIPCGHWLVPKQAIWRSALGFWSDTVRHGASCQSMQVWVFLRTCVRGTDWNLDTAFLLKRQWCYSCNQQIHSKSKELPLNLYRFLLIGEYNHSSASWLFGS